MVYIENEYLKVGVAEHGAELSSVYDKKNSAEILWQADKNFWGRHAPVLFPIVGKVANNTYRHGGSEYSLSQHGFARDRDFSLVSKDDNLIVMSLKSDADTRKVYPFDFELIVTHSLLKNSVKVEWQVINHGSSTMYFAIGGHPAFNVPRAGDDHKRSDYFIKFEKDELTYKLLDPKEGIVVNDRTYTLKTENGYVKIADDMFSKDALVFDDYEIEKAALCNPDKTPYVTVEAKGFPSFGIWSANKDNCPFVCLEPWIGRADNLGFTGELKDKYKEISLASKESFDAYYFIKIGSE